MTSFRNRFQQHLFSIVSRVCFTTYHYFPIFGTLRASIGIVQRQGKFLVIHRNDGRGLCLPGGISGWHEAPEETLRREIREETGMTVTRLEYKFTYYSKAEVPCNISVFEVRASGEPENSWEGSPRWTAVEELEAGILPSQRAVLGLLKSMRGSSEEDKH